MTLSEQWANDYLENSGRPDYLIRKYNLQLRPGESVLAAMFDAFKSDWLPNGLPSRPVEHDARIEKLEHAMDQLFNWR